MVNFLRTLRGRLHKKRFLRKLNRGESVNFLKHLISNYNVDNLKNVSPQKFKEKINSFLRLNDWRMEGFNDPKSQRDLTVKFHWGHNHNFGSFDIKGKMGDRHINILATFIDQFHALPKDLTGLKVLDIGCWTGGTSLLLCAMGAHVTAIDEVKKYIESLYYLKYAFDIENLEPRHFSLYECIIPEFQDQFDIVLFSGVLYHVTDPIVALRITFNCLKDGGICLLETRAIDSGKSILSYERDRWNWYIPSPSALHQMMVDVGFSDVKVSNVIGSRAFAVGKRDIHKDMRRDGLSVRTIR